MHTPSISVIIPIYNSEKYIKECLDSVINQSLQDIEIICIDDCSTDNSAELIKKYNDTRIKYIKLEKNSGSGIARNKGIETACGKYIGFLDADDYFGHNNVLETLYSNASEYSVVISGGNLIAIDENTNEERPSFWKNIFFEQSGIKEYQDYLYPAGYWRFIYEKDFLIKNKISFPNYKRRQDPPFFVKAMSIAKRFYITNEIVYKYRLHHKVVNWDKKNLTDAIKSFEDCFTIHQENKQYKHIEKELEDLIAYIEIAKKRKYKNISTLTNEIIKKINTTNLSKECNQTIETIKKLSNDIVKEKTKPEVEIVHIMKTDKVIKPFVDFINKNFDKTKHLFLCERRYDYFNYEDPTGSNVIMFDDLFDYDLTSSNIKKIIVHGLFITDIVGYLFNNKELLKKSYWQMWGNDLYCAPRGEANDFVRENFKGYINKTDEEYAKNKYKMQGMFFDALYTFPINKKILDNTIIKDKKYIQIQINNSSCDSTIEMLKTLAKFKNENIKVNTIVSYGKHEYKKEIIETGKDIFKEKFSFIENILPPKEFANHLANNDVLILNQNRQQGAGNIIASLYLKKKVFINNDVSTSKYFKDQGLSIYDSNNINSLNFEEFIAFDKQEKNHQISEKFFEDKKLIAQWKKIFDDN